MSWQLPGTVLLLSGEEAEHVGDVFRPMFLAGDIMLGQVAALTGLEPYIIQNWVRRGFLSPPVDKRYSLRQLCRVININMLRSVLPMERICGMLTYINGRLDDESDDLIDDAQLYFLFTRLAFTGGTPEEVLRDYEEPVPGAGERVANVLRVMLTANEAARKKAEAEELLSRLL